MRISILAYPFRDVQNRAQLPDRWSSRSGALMDEGRETLAEEERDSMRFVVERVLLPGSEPLEMKSCYAKDGSYVGDHSVGRMLARRGIVPERIANHNVASIGFCTAEQKWYGWSHMAMVGFGLGDKLFVADYGNDQTLFTEHGPVTIKHLKQARRSAIDFADYVS